MPIESVVDSAVDSAVEFATETRIHIGLSVRDVERATSFYQRLFGQAPTKTRPGYAKFEPAEPPVNLSLIQRRESDPSISTPDLHYGIQVKSIDAVERMAKRLADSGISVRMEHQAECCHATQTKAWVRDPDGNPWEVFVVLDDAPAASAPPQVPSSCC